MSTNVTGVFLTVQAAAPYLRKGASVILIGSVHAVLGMPGYAAYAASNGAVRAMGRVLASELSQRTAGERGGAGCNPDAEWGRHGRDSNALAALKTRMVRAVPTERISEAEEIANRILFLASDEATNIQAWDIAVDGGLTGSPSGAPIYRG